MKVTHGETRFPCQYCGKTFGIPTLLDQHVKYVHLKTVKESVPCPTCGKKVLKKCLKNHIDIVHNKVRFKCSHCPKSYATRADMVFHEQAVHCGRKMNCRFCDREFGRTSDRNRHERTVHAVLSEKSEK